MICPILGNLRAETHCFVWYSRLCSIHMQSMIYVAHPTLARNVYLWFGKKQQRSSAEGDRMSTLAKVSLRRAPVQPMLSIEDVRKKRTTLSGEPLAAVAHDARNVLAALRLYCDLLAEPGVLAAEHRHFAAELQAVAAASSGLVERLAGLGVTAQTGPRSKQHQSKAALSPADAALPLWSGSSLIDDLATAVHGLAGPLEVLAGTKIDLHVECLPCPGRLRLSQENLTRILINLTRNAAEAMPHGGRIRVTVQQGGGGNFFERSESMNLPRTVLLCIQDTGPGISGEAMRQLFDAGFTTKKGEAEKRNAGAHRGLGLSIVRRLAEAAGGCVRVVSTPGHGARFEVELPLIDRRRPNNGFLTDFPERAHVKC
jgi:signal transduction histidine kinase